MVVVFCVVVVVAVIVVVFAVRAVETVPQCSTVTNLGRNRVLPTRRGRWRIFCGTGMNKMGLQRK